MTPKQISEMLAARVDDVCRELLPEGKRKSNEWKCGSVSGEPGDSLGVHMAGEKAGVWCDFATGETGDLLDLWAAARGLALVDAIGEAKSFLGVQEQKILRESKKNYAKPEKPKCSASAPELDYLKSRGLTEETLKSFRVAGSGGKVYFPFIHDDELVMCKWRDINSKKTAPTSKDQKPVLFGWQAMPDSARRVYITEGEIDAMSMTQMGYPALSVPFGGGTGAKHQWIENEYDRLERFDEIYLAMDTDEPGKQAAAEIIERLGRHRCRYVILPEKDANECLQQGLSVYVDRAIKRAVSLDPVELRPASTYADEVYYEIFPDERPVEEDVIHMPAMKGADDFQLRLGELVLATGVNGHGKSEFLGHLIVDAMRASMRWCIASMELRPGRLVGRMTQQAAGCEKPTRDYQNAILNWYDDKLWIFDVNGTAKATRIIDVFEYAFKRYGIRHFLIDSLMKCGIADDDYAGQKAFLESLCDFKNKYNVCIIIVAHARKLSDETQIAGKFDVLGASAITNLIDSGFTVWRNKKKEQIARGEREPVSDEEFKMMPDCRAHIWKQRNGSGWEGKLNFWFDPGSRQYRPAPDSKPFEYVKYSKLEAIK